MLHQKDAVHFTRAQKVFFSEDVEDCQSAPRKAVQRVFEQFIESRQHFFLKNIFCLTFSVPMWPRVEKAGAVNFHWGKILGGILNISGNARFASNNK